MTLNHEGARGSAVIPRVALLSILCFWLVYFAVATIRSLMIDWGHQTEMLAARGFVTAGSMVATYIVYLAMRPLAGKSLAINVTAVALLAIPAAVAYSSMNWMAFQQVDRKIQLEKEHAARSTRVVIDEGAVTAARDQALAAITAAHDAIREAAKQSKAAAEAKAKAQREEAAARQEAERRSSDIRREKAQALRDPSPERAAAMREAWQAQREAAREALEAQRDAWQEQRNAYRDAYDSYKENVEEARKAVEEAKRHGVTIDIDSILSSIPAPPPPPAPPAPELAAARPVLPVPGMTAPAPAAQAKPALAPRPSAPTAPPASHPPAATPQIVVPPMPSVGTVMIQVGQPADPHRETEMPVLAQIGDQALNGYFFFAAWGALFLALSYAAAVRVAEREAANYRAAARDAELKALRYQINPHFLFNTLNSLSTLILKERGDAAEAMILNLSTFFRTSLTADPTADVPLSEEIRLQRLYLDIEAVRFPERLNVDIEIPPELGDACVPCLILQPLVENAIKYGVSRAKRPVAIRICARADSHGLVLTVEDDGDPLGDDGSLHGAGVGLKNVTDRLRARFGDDATCRYGPLANGGFGVTLFMPLIRNAR